MFKSFSSCFKFCLVIFSKLIISTLINQSKYLVRKSNINLDLKTTIKRQTFEIFTIVVQLKDSLFSFLSYLELFFEVSYMKSINLSPTQQYLYINLQHIILFK